MGWDVLAEIVKLETVEVDATRRILRVLLELRNEVAKMSDAQSHLDADVAALVDGFNQLEAEIATLKQQAAAGATLDFTAADNLTASVKAAVDAITTSAPPAAP